MPKPVSPQQVQSHIKPKDRRKHLKTLVQRKLNRELKKGLKSIKVPNHIDPDLAEELAEEYRAQGWTVTIEDHRHTMIGDIAWRYTFG